MSDGETSLLDRAREVLATIRDAKPGDDAASMPEAVARQVAESLARWQGSASIRRFLGVPTGRDVLAAAGSAVWLEAKVGPIVQMGASQVRFVLGDRVLGTCRLEEHGPCGIEVELETPGRHAVRLEPLGPTGASLGPPGVAGELVAYVASSEAVVGIDAGLVLDAHGLGISAIQRLQRSDVQLFYFDLATEDRTALIRSAIEEHGLPDGAVLTHPDDVRDIDPGNADFSHVFGLTAVRRLRACGVPVVAGISARSGPATDDAAVEVLPPQALTPSAIARLHSVAQAFSAARKTVDTMTWRLDQATETRLVPGNRLTPEFDNRAARERLFELVDGAKDSIHLQTYIFREGQVSNALVVRLVRRAREGVRVRVIVDALYSGEQVLGSKNPLVESLSLEPNVEVVVGSPIELRRPIDSMKLKQRDHRKLLVVDGRMGFVTGRNISDAYYRGFDETPIHHHTAHEHIPWLDAHVEIEGPMVEALQRMFRAAWTTYGGDAHPHLESVGQATAGSCAARLVVHKGLRDANGMLQYEAMLDASRKHVYIVNDFPIVPSLASAMHRALARGVRLVLLTGNAVARRADGTFFPGPVYRELFEHMVKQRLEPLIRRGAEVFEYVAPPHPAIVPIGGVVRPYVHAKVMSVDGRVSSIGSANLDATASYWEHEANVVVQDEAFATGLEQQLESMLARAHSIDLDSDYWKRDRSKRAIVSKLWPSAVYS